jgi:hypothetical protein
MSGSHGSRSGSPHSGVQGSIPRPSSSTPSRLEVSTFDRGRRSRSTPPPRISELSGRTGRRYDREVPSAGQRQEVSVSAQRLADDKADNAVAHGMLMVLEQCTPEQVAGLTRSRDPARRIIAEVASQRRREGARPDQPSDPKANRPHQGVNPAPTKSSYRLFVGRRTESKPDAGDLDR